MSRTLRTLTALSILAGLAAPLAAQEETAVFRTDSRLVVLHATVLDQEGRLVTDLPRTAFRIYENGVEQELKVFRREDAPVSVGFVIDDSGSMIDKRQRVAAAALALVNASHPGDEVFVIHFNEKTYLDTTFTRDRGRLEQALAVFDSRGTTAMRDAIRLAVEHLERRASEDKKVLILVSDGEDNTSVISRADVIQAAQQSGVLIYAMGILHQVPGPETERARQELDALTQATGGQAFYLNDVSEAPQAAQVIARDIRNQYTLAYTPWRPDLDGTFRKIQVVASGPAQLTVRTRSGYWASRKPAPRGDLPLSSR